MSTNELLQYYEDLVRDHPAGHEPENPHLREFVTEVRDAWEHRVILRELRHNAGTAVCCGEVDCLEQPTEQCMRGVHPTCPSHTDCCYLCVPVSAWSANEAR